MQLGAVIQPLISSMVRCDRIKASAVVMAWWALAAVAGVARNEVTASNWIHRIFIFKMSMVILAAAKWTIMHSIRFYCRHKIAIMINCRGNIVNVRASHHRVRAAVDAPCSRVSFTPSEKVEKRATRSLSPLFSIFLHFGRLTEYRRSVQFARHEGESFWTSSSTSSSLSCVFRVLQI